MDGRCQPLLQGRVLSPWWPKRQQATGSDVQPGSLMNRSTREVSTTTTHPWRLHSTPSVCLLGTVSIGGGCLGPNLHSARSSTSRDRPSLYSNQLSVHLRKIKRQHRHLTWSYAAGSVVGRLLGPQGTPNDACASLVTGCLLLTWPRLLGQLSFFTVACRAPSLGQTTALNPAHPCNHAGKEGWTPCSVVSQYLSAACMLGVLLVHYTNNYCLLAPGWQGSLRTQTSGIVPSTQEVLNKYGGG